MLDHNGTSRSNSRKEQPAKPAGRKHPVTAVTRLKHGTKGRAKDVARARGMSLCAFIRQAVQDALRTDKRNPDAV